MSFAPVGCAACFIRARRGKPWLVVGKGPSLDRRAALDLCGYQTLTLNHACRLVAPTLAHFTDLEAFRACAAALPEDARVVLPYVPHVAMRPGDHDLDTLLLFGREPLLDRLVRAGRVLAYNSTRVGPARRRRGLATVRVRLFSAVAAFNLLAAAGVGTVHTLGVDGGTAYAAGLDDADRLANGRASFDEQFDEIRLTLARRSVRWVDLGRPA